MQNILAVQHGVGPAVEATSRVEKSSKSKSGTFSPCVVPEALHVSAASRKLYEKIHYQDLPSCDANHETRFNAFHASTVSGYNRCPTALNSTSKRVLVNARVNNHPAHNVTIHKVMYHAYLITEGARPRGEGQHKCSSGGRRQRWRERGRRRRRSLFGTAGRIPYPSLAEDLLPSPIALPASDPVFGDEAACLRSCMLEGTPPPAWVLQMVLPATTRPAGGPAERQIGEVRGNHGMVGTPLTSPIGRSVGPLSGRVVADSTICRTHARGGASLQHTTPYVSCCVPEHRVACRKRPGGS